MLGHRFRITPPAGHGRQRVKKIATPGRMHTTHRIPVLWLRTLIATWESAVSPSSPNLLPRSKGTPCKRGAPSNLHPLQGSTLPKLQSLSNIDLPDLRPSQGSALPEFQVLSHRALPNLCFLQESALPGHRALSHGIIFYIGKKDLCLK